MSHVHPAVRLLLMGATATCVVIVGMNAYLLVGESGDWNRARIVSLVLLLLGLWGAWDCWVLSRELHRPLQHVRAGWRANGRYEVPALSGHSYVAALVVGCTAALAVVGSLDGHPGFLLSAAALSGLAGMFFFWHRLNPAGGRPALWMDASGLWHHRTGRLAWTQVHGVAVQKVAYPVPRGRPPRLVPRLVLLVDQPNKYRATLPLLANGLTPEEQPTDASIGVFCLWLHDLDCQPALLLATAQRLRAAVSPPPFEGWHPGTGERELLAWRAGLASGPVAPAPAPQVAPAPEALADEGPEPLSARDRRRAAWVAFVTVLGALQVGWTGWH